MTIKFHYHYHPDHTRRSRGGRDYCHVYSDDFASPDRGRKELEDWMAMRGIPKSWLHKSTIDHLDLWGSKLSLCGEGISSEEFVQDMRKLRAIRKG